MSHKNQHWHHQMTTFQIFVGSGHYESPQLKLDVDQEGSG